MCKQLPKNKERDQIPHMVQHAIVVLRSESSLIKVCYVSYSDCERISQIEPRLYSATQARYKVAAVGFENP